MARLGRSYLPVRHRTHLIPSVVGPVLAGSATSGGTITATRTVYAVLSGGATSAGTVVATKTVNAVLAGAAVSSGTIAATIAGAGTSSVLRLLRKRGAMAISHVIATIDASGTTSNAINLQNGRLLAFQMPTALTSTSMTFTARPGLTDNPGSTDNDAYQAVVNDTGTAVSVTVAASKYISTVGAVRDALDGVGYLKLVAGSSEAAARRIICVIENGRG